MLTGRRTVAGALLAVALITATGSMAGGGSPPPKKKPLRPACAAEVLGKKGRGYTGPQGRPMLVSGDRWAAESTVEIDFDGVPMKSVEVDSDGEFQTDLLFPSDATRGSHSVNVSGHEKGDGAEGEPSHCSYVLSTNFYPPEPEDAGAGNIDVTTTSTTTATDTTRLTLPPGKFPTVTTTTTG